MYTEDDYSHPISIPDCLLKVTLGSPNVTGDYSHLTCSILQL